MVYRIGLSLGLAALPLLLVSSCFGQQLDDKCVALAKLSLPHTRVVSETLVAAGGFVPPSGSGANTYKNVPAFCRVIADAMPSTDSLIKIEVWLPAAGWNGKFRGQGNGGFAGEISYGLMGQSVAQGYATAGTDAGHSAEGTDASWAIGHPEKVIDFGYRAIHEMTGTAKLIVDAYYGKLPERAYFAACSDGGREALMEAQRYPQDYDGILAGAPAYYWTNMVASGMHKMQVLTRDAASFIPPSKVPAIDAAVRTACDAPDGVTDGIVNDPRRCDFKPEALLCTSAETDACLTAPQVQSLKTLYAPTLDAKGKVIYPASLPGGEDGPGGWPQWVLGATPDKSLSYLFTTGYFKNMVYEDPTWNYHTFNLDDGLKAAVQKTAAAVNATDADLKAFSGHGGKLILYHGWSDPAIAPLSTVEYYQRVTKRNAEASNFVRLFMAPGMQHCSGGPGPSSFGQLGYFAGTGVDDAQHDLYLSLERWVEKGIAPEQVIAAKLESDGKAETRITMSRPLCAYPMVAKYKGAGDTNDAASFSCVADKK